MIINKPDLFFRKLCCCCGSVLGSEKKGADIFEIVLIGPGLATMVIVAVGVIPGDARPEA